MIFLRGEGMKKYLCVLMISLMLINFPVSVLADCVSQYCICDGKMHDCSFTDAQCQALCGGGEAQYDTKYHKSNTENTPLYLGFTVAFVAIGLVLYFGGAFNEGDKSVTAPGVLKVNF